MALCLTAIGFCHGFGFVHLFPELPELGGGERDIHSQMSNFS
jgi:hypothetical protein